MAKAAKKQSAKAEAPRPEGGPLAEATAAFARGDYGRAKLLLRAKAEDASLAEGERAEARERLAATAIERGTLAVGLACIGLLALVIVVTRLLQP